MTKKMWVQNILVLEDEKILRPKKVFVGQLEDEKIIYLPTH